MAGISISIVKEDGTQAIFTEGEKEAVLVYECEYKQGDRICVEAQAGNYLVIQLDDAMGESLVYVTETCMSFPVPFQEKKDCYSPKSFSGSLHLLTARYASAEETGKRYNMSCNPYDCHEAVCCYPHASANVETRGESVFAARNAIDGNHANTSHGKWPYESWGINRDPQAKMRIEFGRKVRIDTLVFYLRADFPHDSWWTNGTVVFSDGSVQKIAFQKTKEAQQFMVEPKVIEWLEIEKLIKAEDDSPFPALSQLEVYGTNV